MRSVLTDKRYIGSVIYGRQQAKGVAAHRNIKAPSDKLVEVENCHEPLVSREYFESTQALLGGGTHYTKSDRPLAGKIKCGVCGHAMPLIKAKEPYFTCGTKWYDSDYSCGGMQYPQEALFEMLQQALRQQIDLRVEQEALRRVEREKLERQRVDLEKELSELECKQAQCKEKTRIQFEKFATGEVDVEDFAGFQRNNKQQTAQQTQEIMTIQQQMRELGEKGRDSKPISLTGKVNDAIMNRSKMGILMELLDKFICEVWLYPDLTTEISWGFDEA